MKSFDSHLTDLLAVERGIHSAVSVLQRDPAAKIHPDVERVLGQAFATSEGHDRNLAPLADPGLLEAAHARIASAVGTLAGLADRARTEHRTSRPLRDLYAWASFAACSYEMLLLMARAAGDARVAELAGRHLEDWTPVLAELDTQVLNALAVELEGEGTKVEPQVLDSVLEQIERAWSPEVARRRDVQRGEE